jgi:hypothetical protein
MSTNSFWREERRCALPPPSSTSSLALLCPSSSLLLTLLTSIQDKALLLLLLHHHHHRLFFLLPLSPSLQVHASQDQALLDFWATQELPEDQKFLRDYILGKQWVKKEEQEALPYYSDIVRDFEEEEEHLDKTDEFENVYNFRFEEPYVFFFASLSSFTFAPLGPLDKVDEFESL